MHQCIFWLHNKDSRVFGKMVHGHISGDTWYSFTLLIEQLAGSLCWHLEFSLLRLAVETE